MSALLIPVGSAGDLHPYIGLALAERLKGVDGLAAAYEVIEFTGSSRRHRGVDSERAFDRSQETAVRKRGTRRA